MKTINRLELGIDMKRMSERRQRRIEKIIARDRRFKKLIYNRIIITFSLILLQMALSGFLLMKLYSSVGKVILFLVNGVGICSVLYIINQNEKPSMKLNWIIIILVFPLVGVVLYLLFGRGRPTKKMHKKITAAKKENAPLLTQSQQTDLCVRQAGRVGSTCQYLLKQAGYPAFSDGDVSYYSSGEEMFAEMLKTMEQAKRFILAEYFIVAAGKMWGAFLSMLVKKANEGVQIRFIFDDWGSLLSLPPKYERYLESLHPNIKCMTFNPVIPVFTVRLNNRDHRKFLIVDGETAFTGGINLADEYINEKRRFGYWKDAGIKVTGSAVRSFTTMFFNVWNAFRKDKENTENYIVKKALPVSETNSAPSNSLIQPYDDSPLDGENVGETVYLDVINRAKDYVYIFTPYLILDDFVRAALCDASKRGVDVRIVTPAIPDKKTVFRLTRANYPPLLKAGVKIYEYTPGFVHSKCVVSDDNCAVVGTINLDYRSLYLHFEDAVYFTGLDAVKDVKKDFEETFPLSKIIEKDTVKRTIFGRLIDSFLRVFETLV